MEKMKLYFSFWAVLTVLIVLALVCWGTVDPAGYQRMQGPPEGTTPTPAIVQQYK